MNEIEKTSEQDFLALQAKYRKLFDSPIGQEVLWDLLDSFWYFDSSIGDDGRIDERRVILKAAAETILVKIGAWPLDDTRGIVGKLLELRRSYLKG